MKYQIIIAPFALRMLQGISDRRIRKTIRDRIDHLAIEPEKQGKPLIGDLIGYRSLRSAGQRYRIIYKIEGTKVTVHVVAVGIRKEGSKADIYELARKLLRLGLLPPRH